MILAVNIGNTHIQIGLFTRGALRSTWRLTSQPARTSDEYALLLRGLAGDIAGTLRGAVMASVVPALEEPVARAIEAEYRVEPLILDKATPLGIVNGYERPEELGMDRLANVVGAHYFFGAPVLAIDLGTAITLDCLGPATRATEQPVYLGGVILPGLELAARALARGTALLPEIAVSGTPRVIGRTTEECIRSGLFHGYQGALQTLVERMKEEIGQTCPVVATGGAATLYRDHLPFVDAVKPDLTLYGLRQIWGFNNQCPLPPQREEKFN